MYDRRHELGQNFLADAKTIRTILRLVDETSSGPILEIGAGEGSLTLPLSRLDRPLAALEIDPLRAARLARRVPGNVQLINADALAYRLPAHTGTIVGNIPFHLTTPILKKLFGSPHWQDAVLVVQWEVARRRAGVGGASMLTAQWWPWHRFELHARIPATAFRPVPSVDAAVLTVRRRATPLVADRRDYQQFVQQVFTGPSRGLAEILARSGRIPRGQLYRWLNEEALPTRALAKDLKAEQWASLWHLARMQRGRAR